MSRNVNPVPQYFDSSGEPLAGGFMFYYISGTTTFKKTYADVGEEIENTNPVELSGDGRLPNVFFTGPVRQILEDANGVQIWERDPVEAGGGSGGFSDYNPLITYSLNDIVIFDDLYYRSLIDGNQNNDPDSSPDAWTMVQFIELWNATVTYPAGYVVKTADGHMYRSLVSSNLNNDPSTDVVNWAQASEGLDAHGLVTTATTVSGYGISSVTQNTTGDFTVTFINSASGIDNQTVVVNTDANTGLNSMAIAGASHVAVDEIRILSVLLDTTPTIQAASVFPYDIHRTLIL
jgi:hypothetical protein